ncbi:MAG: hypothetical protein COB76_01875 [Alphaproteobacteria bacterium]|nr:MAG: hypothetical protein COB76_01875 [Alphaproteobacteria bacterium]
MHNDIITARSPNAGPLRIGVIPTIAPYFLPQCLPNIEAHFPESDLRIAEDTTETILKKIKNGDLDLGILAFPVDTKDLEIRILFNESFVLAAPKSLKLKKTVSLESVQDANLLLLREGHCLKDHILSACKLPPEKQNRFFEAESLNTLLAMVNQGYGVTLLPEMAIKANIQTAYPHVKIHKFSAPAPVRQIGLVWRKTDIRRNGYLTLDL